jgi:hypothetical protein
MDLMEIMRNPLVQTGRSAHFVRLVLSEAANYGMPGNIITMLDDVASLLGLYDPIPTGQAGHLAGPLVQWRTHPGQPIYERIRDVEKLAFKQRSLIAFGGAKPGLMIGTAEIVIAMGNLIEGMSPPEYFELFTWASIDVLKTLTGDSAETILRDPAKKGWKIITDDDVLKPGGRLYNTYSEVATIIRREAIEALSKDPDNPREYLRPIAIAFLKNHRVVRKHALVNQDFDTVERLEGIMDNIKAMYPGIDEQLEKLEAGPIVEKADASS